MLPSFRLVAVTFLFGFVAVFAGLRIAAVTRVAHDTVAGLATQAIAAPIAPLQAAAPPPITPVSAAPVAEPPRFQFIVPVMFNLDSVISITASAPEAVPIAPDITLAPAEPAPLTIPPEMALRSLPERVPVEPKATPVEPKATPVEPDVTPVPAELTPLVVLPEIALRSEPEAVPVEPPVAAAETPTTHEPPEPPVAEPAATGVPAGPPPVAEVTGSAEPAAAAPPQAAMDALNQLHDAWPATVWIKLPVAKPPLRAKTKTARAKRPRAARQAAANDPFSFNFSNSQRPF